VTPSAFPDVREPSRLSTASPPAVEPVLTPAAEAEAVSGSAPWWRPVRRFVGVDAGGAGLGLLILGAVVGAGLLAPVWIGGTWTNPLGTDSLGRDLLSRILYGARTSLVLALGAVAIAAAFGVVMGLVSGWVGGRLDAVVTSVVEVQLSLPYLLFAIAFMALLEPGLLNLVIVLVLRSWVVYARLVRVAVLSMKEREFVTVAVALGAGDGRILLRHILPNVVAPVLVVSSFQLAELIIVESSLSFLGLGVQPPMPSWGSMLSQGREYISSAWWLVTFPGLAIILTVLGANLAGDAVRDLMDPRLRGLGRARTREAGR
jgi:peptide/nickel transport system permease protein